MVCANQNVVEARLTHYARRIVYKVQPCVTPYADFLLEEKQKRRIVHHSLTACSWNGKCGYANPTAETLWTWAQEIDHAIKTNFWGKKGRPSTEPMKPVTWDMSWLHRHVFPAPPLPHTTNRRGDANCA